VTREIGAIFLPPNFNCRPMDYVFSATPKSRVVQSLREVTDEEEIFENFISNQPKRCFLDSPSLGENRTKKKHNGLFTEQLLAE